MKTFILTLMLVPIISAAQTSSLQVAPSISIGDRHKFLYGAQLATSICLSKTLSLGVGINAMQFKNDDRIYLPVYGVIKLNIPVKAFALSFDAFPGYGIYNKENTTGGFYFSSGLTAMLHKKLSPFLSMHYTKYEYHQITIYPNTNTVQTMGTNAFTISLGISLNFKKHLS